MPTRVLILPALFLGLTGAAQAQLISIRTVPISQAHQFDIFPSYTMAMGGVSIAVADSLLDPFTNPAKGSRLGTARFFGSPSVYSVSSEAGGGRSFPLGALVKAGSWYGGVALALQEVDLSERNEFLFPFLPCPTCLAEGIELGQNERSHGNAYVFAMTGKEVAPGLSLGGSLLWSQLHAVDGVDLLYAASARVKQYGDAVDLRLGLLKEWAGNRSLETMLLYNRYATTHDVFYLDLFWDPATQGVFQRPRLEQNLDRTNTWGLHAEYEQPLPGTSGWRIGGLATVNLASHPKIPNYEIQNIPRDPGNSSAFNVGVGIAKTHEASTFGIDVVYEPIWSYTWADAAEPIQTAGGETIPAGGKTIENRFRFSNALLRMGFGQDLEFDERRGAVGLQLGLILRNISYSLDQQDNVQLSERRLDEQWVEWTPTWGLSLRFPALEIRYRGSATNGTGRPGVANGGPIALEDVARAGSIIVAPSGPLTLDEVTVVTHQFSLSLPLR